MCGVEKTVTPSEVLSVGHPACLQAGAEEGLRTEFA